MNECKWNIPYTRYMTQYNRNPLGKLAKKNSTCIGNFLNLKKNNNNQNCKEFSKLQNTELT